MQITNNGNVNITSFDNNHWLQLIALGGCFILAEAVNNEAVINLTDTLSEGKVDACRLYWGEEGREHHSISPYLLMVTEASWPKIHEVICSKANWGVAIVLEPKMRLYTPAQQFTLLLTHLRQWSLIETKEGPQILRLSDWQVLSSLLIASDEQELSSLFGFMEQVVFTDVNDTWQSIAPMEKKEITAELQSPRILSENQILALAEMSNLDINKQYQDHLRAHHAETLNWSAEKMQYFIKQQSDLASGYGFNNPQDKVRFLSLSVIFGDAFANEPWAQSVLNNKEVTGSEGKMDKLHKAALAELG